MGDKGREESEIFDELSELCSSSGYIHIIAYFCFRDNTIFYKKELEPKNFEKTYSHERLIRTEISTLIGLMCKNKINFNKPKSNIMEEYINRTDELLKEIHNSMIQPLIGLIKEDNKDFNLLKQGCFLREAIFYAGESAYGFQYREFLKQKYKNDNDWFESKKGFNINSAESIVSSILNLYELKLNGFREELNKRNLEEWTALNLFTFTIDEIIKDTNLDKNIITCFLESFTFSDEHNNKTFLSLSEFNKTNAYPLLPFDNTTYILLQPYSLFESLYETPFYWFMDDKKYKSTAMKNRGAFTEEFSAERLKLVFGTDNVFENVNIYEGKNIVGEVDILVVFADRAIVLQAKSKRLTLESRKGNDNTISKDFKNAVQDAYNQGKDCADYLQDIKYTFFDSNSKELLINRKYKEIYILCVVSDHYPSLAFQVDQFLEYEESKIIKPPFVMDIFLLDVMTEMLSSPLYLLSYINRRTKYFKKINAQHEIVILSYHLQKNLFMTDEFDMMIMDDDIAADLDQAMFVRRTCHPGKDTPIGILTKFKNTLIDDIIKEISFIEESYSIELGFLLLQLSEDAIISLNEGIKKIINLSIDDGENHDISMGFGKYSTGLTIHSNNNSYVQAFDKLLEHCTYRKYKQKANNWFGLCIDPITKKIKFGIMSNEEWEYSNDMDNKVQKISKSMKFKIGRNELCPCESGKKYKKCCIGKR